MEKKVLSINAKDDLDEERLERICAEEERCINAMPDGIEKFKSYAALAETYIDNDMDNGALRLCAILTKHLQHPANAEEKLCLERAVNCLMALRRSDNEFIWEQSGKLLDAFI